MRGCELESGTWDVGRGRGMDVPASQAEVSL